MTRREEQLLSAIGEARGFGGFGTGAGGGAGGSWFGGTRPNRAGGRVNQAFAVALLALFLFALLGSVWVGTTVYQRLNARSEAAADARSPLGVIVNAARATDSTGSVERAVAPSGSEALVLVEHLDTGAYETRFWLEDGWVVEQYAVAGAPYDAESATRVSQSGTFWFEIEGSLLSVGCDAGVARVALRSEGATGGA